MIRAILYRLENVFPRWRSSQFTGYLGKVALTGPARVEFRGHYVVDVRWLLRVGEFFMLRGAHVSVEWEHFAIVLRGWFQVDWTQVPKKKGGYRWSIRPRFTLMGHEPC